MIRFFIIAFEQMRRRRGVSFAIVVFLLLTALAGNALTFYLFEHTEDPSVTLGDSIWYSIISITTIGYGDFSAKTTEARLGTVFFIILIGLSVFTIFLGLVTDWMTRTIMKGQRGMSSIYTSKHIVIVNFPSEVRIRQIIDEIKSDVAYSDQDIIILTDQVKELPFDIDGVRFIYGSPLDTEPYERAGIKKAHSALVLAASYDDPKSDAIAASAATIIESINPDVKTVVESVVSSHSNLFRATGCDALVSGLDIAGSLLVQELHDPGVTRVIADIASNLRNTTLYSTAVDAPLPGMSYRELAKKLIDRSINLISVLRNDKSHTGLGDLFVEKGDTVVYIADKRRTWSELQ